MRLVFANWAFENHGSAQDLYHYVLAARALGHEVVLYGPPQAKSPFTYSLDVGPDDALVFIFEFTTYLQFGDSLDLARLVSGVPRHRRVVIDCDGAYAPPIRLDGDANHRDAASSRRWVEICDSLSDKIFQPTLHPEQPNVGTFFFHAYNPAWEQPLDFRRKEYGMVYVGNNWYRWRGLERVLRAVEPIRAELGRIGLVGNGWDGAAAPSSDASLPEEAFRSDTAYLRRLGVEIVPPVRFHDVVAWMSKGLFTPVLYRPLFDRLRLVTCRTFETPAASSLPVFTQEPDFVSEIYGDEAVELVLPERRPEDKLLDLLARPERYAGIVQGIRRTLAEKYSYEAQLLQLVAIVQA